MSDWRTILKAPPPAQYPQNTQNGEAKGDFEDSEDFEEREKSLEVLSHDLYPGAWITWPAADLTIRGPAHVDFLHRDADGTVWAFVTYQQGWAAVNTKFATLINEGGHTHG